MDLYPEDPLWEEVVYLAYHLHWVLDQLLDIEHGDRVRLVERVAALNNRALEQAKRMIG